MYELIELTLHLRYSTKEECFGGDECTGTWFAGPYGPCSTEDKCGVKGEMKRWATIVTLLPFSSKVRS